MTIKKVNTLRTAKDCHVLTNIVEQQIEQWSQNNFNYHCTKGAKLLIDMLLESGHLKLGDNYDVYLNDSDDDDDDQQDTNVKSFVHSMRKIYSDSKRK